MNEQLFEAMANVLRINDREKFTIPAEGLYPHQWLWDSCFIAIGLRHMDTSRAQTEIISLLRGQWSNGMLPHMIFADGDEHKRDRDIWRSSVSPYAPDDVATTGITQPPMMAEAIWRVGEKLPPTERRTWFLKVLPALIRHHEWLYADRDPHNEGLVLQIHPYETGLDNTPPWISELHKHSKPWWATFIEKTGAVKLVDLLRRDTSHLPPGQRMSNMDALLYFAAVKRIKRKGYNTEAILSRSLFCIEDVSFNSIFIRSNKILRDIAKAVRHELPEELLDNMRRSEDSIEQFWDAYSGSYFSRNFITHKHIKEPSIATLLPLYSGVISKERAAHLVSKLKNQQEFGTRFPIPSVPVSSSWFKELGYWQGPSWINTNWLIIDGLRRYGYHAEADAITKRTLKMVEISGSYEYFNPLDGSPAGAKNFSWTAALIMDMIKNSR